MSGILVAVIILYVAVFANQYLYGIVVSEITLWMYGVILICVGMVALNFIFEYVLHPMEGKGT